MFDIEKEIKKLPETPGVYMHKDNLGNVIYVGKAVNLKRRVGSYFRSSAKHTAKIRAMVSKIAEFEYIDCATEMEALVLECNLIKKYMPKYNILMKDDKTYPYIAVTLDEKFPRVIRTRKTDRSGNKYYGPYSDSGAVRRMIRLISDLYPIKKCHHLQFPAGVRPCLNYFIGKCKGVCIGAIDREEYMNMIREIITILEGRDSSLLKELRARMDNASEELRYEDAAIYRDYISAIEKLGETQRATVGKAVDVDILLPMSTKKNKIVAQYSVREGKMTYRKIFYMENTEDEDPGGIVSAFIEQHYSERMKLPREIIISENLRDEKILEDLLNEINKSNAEAQRDLLHKTKIKVPKRGKDMDLLKMAQVDASDLTSSIDERFDREKKRDLSLRRELSAIVEKACRLNGSVPYILGDTADREYRIEAYDISNMNGLDAVGAMVVYEGRKKISRDYRKFRIRSAAGGDDYGSLQEVIYRRLKRAKRGDFGFDKYPDIMFIDGGLGQVHAVKAVVDAFKLNIPIVGLAKDEFHRTRAVIFEDGSEIDLKKNSMLFTYAGAIQEEVHRFAITYQRSARGKKMIRSGLEEIPEIGPKRRKALLSRFRDIDNIRSASYTELMKVEGMTSKAAENVVNFFNNNEK